MKESATLILNEEQIKRILFYYYIATTPASSEMDEEIDEEMLNDLKFESKIIYNKKGRHIDFILTYKNQIESLDADVEKEIVVNIDDLNNIINQRLTEEKYEIDSLEEHLSTEFNQGERTFENSFRYIKYNLKKKEKVKTKKKGWR